MPKIGRWFQPLRNRLPVPMPVSQSRKVKMGMIERVSTLIKGGIIHKPLWYDAVMAHPPPEKIKGQKPFRLTFDDDKLRSVYLKRNPAATLKPKALFLDQNREEAWHEHEADAFVRQQKAHMRKGATEEEAYRLVLQKQKEQAEHTARTRRAEVEMAQKRAAAVGATQGTGSAGVEGAPTAAEQLLRKFAEEARDAGEPFPKHWFADGGAGAWVGIGTTQTQMGLEAATRKALTNADIGTISAILGTTSLDDSGDGAGAGGDGGASEGGDKGGGAP